MSRLELHLVGVRRADSDVLAAFAGIAHRAPVVVVEIVRDDVMAASTAVRADVHGWARLLRCAAVRHRPEQNRASDRVGVKVIPQCAHCNGWRFVSKRQLLQTEVLHGGLPRLKSVIGLRGCRHWVHNRHCGGLLHSGGGGQLGGPGPLEQLWQSSSPDSVHHAIRPNRSSRPHFEQWKYRRRTTSIR